MGFADEVGDIAEACRELVLVVGKPRTHLDEPRDGRIIEREQVLLLLALGDIHGILFHVLLVPVHPAVKIGLYLEQLARLFVVCMEQIVEVRDSRQG